MKKRILAMCLFTSFVFANNTQNNGLNKLLNQLQAFQQKIISKNVTLASNKEIEKLNKQINLLNKQIMYTKLNNNLIKEQKNTLNGLKKITTDLFYLIKKEYKNYKQNQKFYLTYDNKIVLNGENLYSVKKADLAQMSYINLNIQDSFNNIKNNYLAAINANDFNIYSNLISQMTNFINTINTNVLTGIRRLPYLQNNQTDQTDQYEYINISSFNCMIKKINKTLKLIILQRCNFE